MYDAGLSLCYRHGNTSLDVGYKVAGHSKEKWKSWVDTIELDSKYNKSDKADKDTVRKLAVKTAKTKVKK